MAKAYSISVSRGAHSEAHSRREYTPKSAEESLASENIIIYDCGNDRDAFNDFFRGAIEEYNARQKRSDRKKDLDYLSALKDGRAGYGKGRQHEQPFYHYVIQIGNRDDLGVTDKDFDVKHWRELKFSGRRDEAAEYVREHLNRNPDREILKQALVDVSRKILEETGPGGRFHGMKVWGMVGHGDEPGGTFHVDLRCTFFCEGQKTGPSMRVSMGKALKGMGYRRRKGREMIQQMNDDVKGMIEERMAELGFERAYMDNHERHKSVSVFEAETEAERLAEEIEALKTEAAAKRKESDEMLSRVAAQQRIIDKGEQAKEELEQAWSDMDAANEAARAAEDDRARFQREVEALKAEAEKYREDAMRETKAEAWDAYVEKVKDLKRRNPKKLYDQILADMERTKGEKVLELGLSRSVAVGAAPLGAEAERALPSAPEPQAARGGADRPAPARLGAEGFEPSGIR